LELSTERGEWSAGPPPFPVRSGASTAVSTNDLRAIPLGHLLDALEREMAASKGAYAERWRQAIDAAQGVDSLPKPGPGGPRDDELRALAEAYAARRAVSRRSPVPAIAAELEVNVSTVHRWLAKARDAGYLEPDDAPEPTPSKKPTTKQTPTRKGRTR
jgi:hypothetical protein